MSKCRICNTEHNHNHCPVCGAREHEGKTFNHALTLRAQVREIVRARGAMSIEQWHSNPLARLARVRNSD